MWKALVFRNILLRFNPILCLKLRTLTQMYQLIRSRALKGSNSEVLGEREAFVLVFTPWFQIGLI